MPEADLQSSQSETLVPNVFALTVKTDLWRAECLRCGVIVAESRDFSDVQMAEALHVCVSISTRSRE